MRKTFPVAIAALFAVGFADPALADRVGAGWISIEQATQKAEDAGYTELSNMHADDGRWERKGIKEDKHLVFYLDPKTGAISDEHPASRSACARRAASLIPQALKDAAR